MEGLSWWTLPRARGGISIPVPRETTQGGSSPRTRGYFLGRQGHARRRTLFPAHAGVFPEIHMIHNHMAPLPRARGGISIVQRVIGPELVSSPRTRGYFREVCFHFGSYRLFPAHAGVFPVLSWDHNPADSLPRARGGISSAADAAGHATDSSPRTRGYFLPRRRQASSRQLFPAHAGVFPLTI